MKRDKLIKRLKKTERGYKINQNAPEAFHTPKAMWIFVLVSIAFSAFISYCVHGPYLNANAGAHFLIFIFVFGLLLASARVILNIICAFVRLFTVPAYLRHRRCAKKLFGRKLTPSELKGVEETGIGLQCFINTENRDIYNVRFLE